MDRNTEIRQLLQLTAQQVIKQAEHHIIVTNTLDELHQEMAETILNEIIHNNTLGKRTSIILPVGPTGQYPILSDKLLSHNISLNNCWLFFMDEYCDDDGKAVPLDHPLSFQRVAKELFLDKVSERCNLNLGQVIFPNKENIDTIPDIIKGVGGIDTCYGGVGIHGHIAFNEPEHDVNHLSCRKVRLNDFTVTINAIRAQVGGNLEGFPRYAYTLGMKEILGAKRIRLYCRNGIDLDWANTILRLALLGEPGDDYPVTHIRNTDYVIVTDRNTLQSPMNIL